MFLTLIQSLFLATTFQLQSPDGRLHIKVVADDNAIRMQLRDEHDSLLCLADAAMTLTDGTQALSGGIRKSRRQRLSADVEAPFYRQASFHTECNQLDVTFRSGFGLQLRAYDEGAAYRLYTTRADNYNIENETALFTFAADPQVWLSHSTNAKRPYAMAFQNRYATSPLSRADTLAAFLPAVADVDGRCKVTLLESDVEDYPGMFIVADSAARGLRAEFAHCPTRMATYPWRKMTYVSEASANEIARCSGARSFPWRIMAVSRDDREMPVGNLVYALASDNRIGNTDWIRPGKVAWEWWNDWNLCGVDFTSGINMATYRYYVDFASAHGIGYVVLDEGWYNPASGDMLTVVPELNLEELVAYAAARNVRLVLWTVFNVLDAQLEAACQKYAAMGIAGFKVDFLDRNDQSAVRMAYRIAERCAQSQLLLDYHGFYTPTGLNRTFPNVLNFESVFGMEEMKWSDKSVNMPLYDVTFPFIRQQCGPVDYTPGAMRNATQKDWNAAYSTPMSQGTRCHQLAAYVVYDSPFTMLCDAPTMYERDEDYTRFLCSLPDTYRETRILAGRIGEYIVTARRDTSGNWFVAGMTNWDERDIDLDFSFLPSDTNFQATIFADGPNAHRQAEDYQTLLFTADAKKSRSIHLAPGGGFVLKLIIEN